MSWPKVRLKDICDLQNGYAFKSSDYVDSSNTLSCRMSNIRPGGVFDIDYNARYLPDDFAEKYSQFLLKDGDVIIAMTDLADAPKILGVPTVVETEGRNVLLNQRVGKLVIKDSQRVHFPYLKLALNYPKVRSVYKRFAGGGLQINLGKNDLLSVEIPLPPLGEQKRIAAILDKADAIRHKRQQAIQLADDFLRSVFLDMFGDPLANPKGWNVEALGKLTTKITDGKHGDCSDEKNSGYYFISAKDVNHGIVNYQNSRQINKKEFDEVHRRTDLKSGDIVMVNTGATIGRVAIVRDDKRNNRTTFQKSVAIIKLDKQALNPTFLKFVFLLRIKDFASVGSGSAIKNLLLSKMREFPIIVPPLELQKDFEKIVLKIEQSSINKKECTVSTLELFNSLSQKAFAGEL